MKTASREYKSSMASQVRNRSFVNISFGNIDVKAGTDGVWVGDHLSWSTYPDINYDHIYNATAVTLELNRWTLNGTQEIHPNTAKNYGWISTAMTDANGSIGDYAVIGSAAINEGVIAPTNPSADSVLKMERTFANAHSLSGVTITFDTLTNEWPLSGVLTFTDESDNEYTAAFQPTGITTPVTLLKEGVKKVSIAITNMLPYRRMRVLTTIWGIGTTFTNEDLVNLTETNDVDPMSRRLPSEKLTFTVLDYEHKYDPDNPEGMYSTINRGAPIEISYGYELDSGDIEWLKGDTYSLENKPTFKNSKVTFTGTGLLATLTDKYYRGALGRKTFYSLAEDVLEDAGLNPLPSGDDPWDIDDSLMSMYTITPLPIQSHAASLQMIAHATNCRLFTDEDNVIHIKPFGVTPVGIFDGEFTDNGHLWYSSWSNVDYGTPPDYTYATLELNRWVLGGNQLIASNDTVALGYVSSQMSDVDGNFTAKPNFTKWFNVTHDVPKTVYTFDSAMEEYPETISVDYRDASGGRIASGTKTVTESPVEVVPAVPIEDCSYIIVTLDKTRIPYRRFRVTKMEYFETDFSLTLDSVKQNTPATSKLERLKDVTVAVYSSNPTTQPIEYSNGVDIASMSNTQNVAYRTSKLFEGDTTETNLHVEFQLARDIRIYVNGVDVTSTHTNDIFARAANVHMSSGTKHVLIEGVPLNESAEVYTYNFSSSGETDAEENVLITDKSMADAHADHVGEYLTLRNTYDADYRGNPEVEVGDIISMETIYGNIVYGIVLVDTISFNGSLSGKLKVKGLV